MWPSMDEGRDVVANRSRNVETHRYFAVLLGPNAPRPLTDDEHGVFLARWKTEMAARNDLRNHIAVKAFGARIFHLDEGYVGNVEV